jgi:trimeric autotransporter adhesin
MSNLIQIKRSLTNATPVGLANGELAFTANGDILFIGSPNGSVVPIGGARTPGVLTANQALVANTTSGIDKILVANLVPTQIWANGNFGSNGQLLTSNGSSIYWQTLPDSVVGSNTEIQFNDSGVLGSDADFTFNKSTNTLTVGASTINSTSFSGTANNALNLGGLAAVDYQTTAGLAANVATLTANNSTNLNGQPASFYTNATNLATGTVPTARLGTGTANAQTFLAGDQSYKTAVTSVASGNGLSGGPIFSTGTLSVQAGDGIVSNTAGVSVLAGTGVTVNSTGIHIGQAVDTTSNVTFANVVTANLSVTGSVSSNLMPSTSNTFHLGNTTIRWAQVHAANVHGVTGIFDGNVEVSGDLIVAGNLVTTNVSSVIVSDAKILLAANNPGDILDIGFSGTYTDGGSTVRHAGLFRDASDNGVFKFFANTTQDLTGNNVVDIGATGYTTAILETFLKSSGLATNSTSVNITANSTVSVGFVANTLSLTTALPATSGGTGINTYANSDLLVGSTGNTLTKLSLGADGLVLQSNGTALVYDSLDGGTF